MQPPADRPSAYRWVIVFSLTSSVGTTLSILFILGLLLPEISEDLDLSPSKQGWLGSSVLLANLFLCIPSNLITSRFKPRRTVTLLFICIGGFTLLQGWASALAVLIVGRVLCGVCFTATQSPRATLIQQWTPRHRLPFTNGVIFAGIDLIMGLALFLTPQIQGWVGGWQNTLYVWGAISLALTVVWLLVGRERETAEFTARMRSQTQTPLKGVLKYKQLWIMGFGMMGAMLGQTALQTFWPTLAEKELGVTPTIVGLALGMTTLAAAPTDFLVNAVPTLVRRQTIILAVGGLMSTGIFLALLYVESEPLIVLLSVFKGFSFSFFPVLMIMVFLLPGIKPREVGLGLAFMETSIWIGSAIGPLLVGFLQEATDNLRFALTVSSFSPLSLIIAAFLIQAVRRSSPTELPAGALAKTGS